MTRDEETNADDTAGDSGFDAVCLARAGSAFDDWSSPKADEAFKDP